MSDERTRQWATWIGTRPSGPVSARLHGVVNILRERSISARDAASAYPSDSQFGAMLRGKAKAFDEAVELLLKLDQGRRLGRRHWWGPR